MTKKIRGFTRDGWVRVQRTVLRRVVGDRLQALLRGDFYVRNHLGEEDYDPIMKEVEALSVDPTPTPTLPPAAENGRHSDGGRNANGSLPGSGAKRDQQRPQSSPQELPRHEFTPELETFIQLIAASIMIDASMRGENAGESDTRFIKKKKKLLAKTLQGPKLGDFRREVLRFDRLRRGEEFTEEEIVESEESRDSSEEESESDSEEEEGGVEAARNSEKMDKGSSESQKPTCSWTSHTHMPPQREPSGESSSDEEHDSTVSDTATSNTSISRSGAEDGFSTSATSSKHQKKKDKKRLKKERKREKKRMKKERRRREKEEKRRRKRKMEKESKAKSAGGGKKRKKARHNEDEGALLFADNELSDGAGDDDAIANRKDCAGQLSANQPQAGRVSGGEEAIVYEIATAEDFLRYKNDLLSQVPEPVKKRFREGAFSRWGKDWLPVLELGPFDVEPGPVRDMWLDMFDNTQESGRDMTRLIFWYGVKYEDRGQAYSFVPETKLITYDEGQRKGYCKIPKKIQKKIERNAKLTKTEEQIKRGLKEIEADMERGKSERAAWMMQFKEDYELAEEEAAQEEADQKLKSASVGEVEEDHRDDKVEISQKRKPGRPKKEDSTKKEESAVKASKRKPGRPKKVVELPLPEGDGEEVQIPKKRKPGRPKKSEKEKAEKAAQNVENTADKLAEKTAEKDSDKAKKKEPTTKKWVLIDEDQVSEIETDDDERDRDYDEDGRSGGDEDLEDDNSDGSNVGKSKKRKTSSYKMSKKKSKPAMTEEEKATERRAKAAEYREKKAREKAEAQGLEYVKGRVGRKSKKTVLEEEQLKFTKCEEVFLPKMERLSEAKDACNVKSVLKCIRSIMERVELLTPPFLRAYPLGMLLKAVRKAFEGIHPEVRDQCKRLTSEMKRVYTAKDKKIPGEFQPVKIQEVAPKLKQENETQLNREIVPSHVPEQVKSEKASMKAERVAIKFEKVANTEKMNKTDKVDIPLEHPVPKSNSSMSLSDQMPRRMVCTNSSDCLPDTMKSDAPQPKQKKTFSIKGMFERPKPAPKPKISAPTPNMIVSGHPSPKPKSLPPWVTGPAVKMEDFHEQHVKERKFGVDFLIDAASLVTSAKKFDPISVSQHFELAIFAETKLRGREWHHYWEKIHDVVAMLSPGKNRRNAILQGIISGDYQEPSELVKLSRREIQSLNQLKS